MGALSDLVRPWQSLSYGFLDGSAKREIRRKILKAIAVPGCQPDFSYSAGWGRLRCCFP